MRSGTSERLAALSAVVAVLAAIQVLFAPAGLAQSYVPISGSGSTWSFNALDQWRRNVESLNGIRVNFSPSGSSVGRNEFRAGTVDFAVSEIEYGLTDGGVVDLPPDQRSFAYMPIVAGGTAFMYNLKIGNNRVTNLRLSGEVIAKIFSQQITNWSDAAIKADNPGLTLPARPIVPVVRSDGSGTTAQLTRWMAAKHGKIWDAYCGRPNCGFTSNFPAKTGMKAKSGSQGVAGEVVQDNAEGAITYVEYSYARNAKFPVAKVLNEAGYYVEPKAPSVAVALTKAGIRDDLTQVLDRVYGEGPGTDRRSYPLSSYSYMILPTDTRQRFTEQKGSTLSDFAYYFLCEGQQQAEALGYSPLPVNLVQAGVKQAARIPGTSNKLTEANLRGCNNPTFSPDGENLLAKTAPQPAECDKQGATQCTTGTGGAPAPTQNNAGGNNAGGNNVGGNNVGGNNTGGNNASSNNAGGNNAGGDNSGGNNAGGDNTTTAAIDPETGAPLIDPETGQLISDDGTQAASSGASAIPVSVDLPDGGQQRLMAVLAVILLVALVLGPPLVSRNLSQRGKS